MSIGQYVLQVTPKHITILSPSISNPIKTVSTLLQFGPSLFKSPYARFIRNNQGSFYGQRLKLTNSLNSSASISLLGIDSNEEQQTLLTVEIDVVKYAENEEIQEEMYEDERVKFVYEVSVVEREISEEEEEYEEGESNRGSGKEGEGESILENILNSQLEIEEKQNTIKEESAITPPETHAQLPVQLPTIPTPNQPQPQPEPILIPTLVPLSRSLTTSSNKQLQLPQTPRLRQQPFSQQYPPSLSLDQSPIAPRTQPHQQQPQNSSRLYRSSLKYQSSVLFVPEGHKEQVKEKSPSGSRVRFIEPVLEKRVSKMERVMTYVLYGVVSMVAFGVGIWIKQNKGH